MLKHATISYSRHFVLQVTLMASKMILAYEQPWASEGFLPGGPDSEFYQELARIIFAGG